LACDDAPELLFTDNEPNTARLWGVPNQSRFVKDGINNAVILGSRDAINPAHAGSNVAAQYVVSIAPSACETILLRLSNRRVAQPFTDAIRIVELRTAFHLTNDASSPRHSLDSSGPSRSTSGTSSVG
jgi:hypothetical protein